MKIDTVSIINKYRKMSPTVKASLWFAISNILQKGISMISVPIFTRILTEEQYGKFSVYQSWYQIICVFATLNLYYGVFNNGMIKYDKERDKFASSLQSLTSIITIILFVVYICMPNFWNGIFNLSTLLVVTMFLELLFSPAFSFWAARQRFEYKYKALVAVTLLVAVGSPIIGVLTVLATEHKAEARILSFAFVQIAVGLIFYIYNARKGKEFYNKEYWSFALKFNVPLIPHYLSQSVLQQSDRIMISSMVGDDKAAIYSVAYSISSLMILVTSAINNSYIPYTYEKLKAKRYKDLKKNTNILLLIIGICVFMVIAFGPEVIRIFAPAGYYEAIWIIPPVAVSVYFMFLYPVFGNVEFYFEENKFVTMASITGAVANIALNYLLIPVFGYIAAGYTTLVCYILFSGGHYIFMKKVVKKHIGETKIYDLKFIVFFSGLILCGMTAMLCVYSVTWLRYLLILIMFMVVCVKRRYFIDGILNMKK